MKRLISILLTAVLLSVCLTGCGSDLKCAVSVGGVEVTEGVYRYYLDYVINHKSEFSLDSESLEGDIEEAADELVKKYVATNSLWAELNMNMTYDLRSSAATQTDKRWDIFGKYYQSIGVTKQDLYKIVKSETYRTALIVYNYGENSKVKPVKTETLKAAFSRKYIGAKIIAMSLMTTDALGGAVKLTGTALTGIQRYFNSMASKANSGSDIDSIYASYNASYDLIGTEGLDTYVFTENSTQNGVNFYKKVSKLSDNHATVVETDDTIYLVYRVDISSDDYEYFMMYKNDILEELYGSKIDKLIEKRCGTLEVEEKTRSVEKIYKQLNKLYSAKQAEDK